MRLDLHVHTVYSYDGFASVEQVLLAAEARGLDGIAVTDHNEVRGALVALRRRRDLTIIPGIEVSSAEGHLIGLGITEKIGAGLPAPEVAERIRELGGIVAIPHPLDPFNGVGMRAKLIKPEAVEVINAGEPFPRLLRFLNQLLARQVAAASIAGSDAHLAQSVGRAHTIIEVESTTLDDVLQAIANCRTEAVGVAIPLRDRVLKAGLALRRRFLRGEIARSSRVEFY